MSITPVKIDEASFDEKPGRPQSDRIEEMEAILREADAQGKSSIVIKMTDEEWLSRNGTLFRSRARRAGENLGLDVTARSGVGEDGWGGEMVIKRGLDGKAARNV